jgi:diaminopimelate epimerase
MEIKFSKIHGLGNDFVVVNEFEGELVKNKAGFAKKFCNRNLGVGSDGILFLCKDEAADFRMRIFNSDGSEAENCVNGLRCVALQKYVLDGSKKSDYKIETLAGSVNAKILSFENNTAVVEIEFLGKKELKGNDSVDVNGKKFEYQFVDVGNPHAVIFMKEPVKDFPVEEIGHKIEFHEKFSPSRTNTEFVNIVSKNEVNMRVHERGACETMACGSGSIAIVIAGIEQGLLEKGVWIKVNQPGGTIEINFDGENVMLKAKAEKVFEGKLEWSE